MPSYNARTKPSPSHPHLSEILNLYPDEEPYCAGYAPSQGRRCHSRTNARGRTTAMSLLNQGTKDLYASRDIKDLLYELASNVLCTRFHQNQDTSLVGKWLRKIDRFLDSYYSHDSPSRTPSASTRSAPTRRKPEPRRRMSPQPPQTQVIPVQTRNRTSDEEARWRTTFVNLQDLEALAERHLTAWSSSQPSMTATSNNRVHSDSRTSRSSSSERPDREDSTTTAGAINSTNIRSQLSRRRSSQESSSNSVSSRSSTAVLSTSPRLVRQLAFTEAEPTSMGDPDMSTSTTVRISARPGESTGPRTRWRQPTAAVSASTETVTRRPVEGDCSICLEPLLRSHDSDDDSDDDDEEQTLAWCRVQCGNNYHKDCIEKWLGTAVKSTCPTCRKPWRT